MSFRSRPSLFAALAALLIVPAAVLGFLSLSTGSTQAGGDGAFLGVHLTEETDLDEGGARVTMVVPDSAADEAGLEVGDVIVEFDGETVRGPMGLSERIDSKTAGDRVHLTVIRDGRGRTLDAELGEKKNGFRVMGLPESFQHLDCDDDDKDCSFSFNFECEGDDCEGVSWQVPSFGRKPLLGVQLIEMTRELRSHMGADGDEGVLVSRVIEDSAAEDSGIEVGDVIVAVDGRRIEDVDDLRRALSKLAGESFDIDVVRDGVTRALGVTLPAAEGFDRSMMHLPQSLSFDVMGIVHQALGQARIDLRQFHSEHADAMKDVRRTLAEARKAQREARRFAAEANSI